MLLADLLNNQYAVVRGLSERSVELYSGTIDRMTEFLGRPPEVADLVDVTVAQFLKWRQTEPIKGRLPKPATVRKDQSHVTALANFAARRRIPGDDGQPMPFLELPRNLVKVPTSPPEAYTLEELGRMLEACKLKRRAVGPVPAPEFFSSMIRAAFYTGERLGGLLGIEWRDVDTMSPAPSLTFRGENRKDRTTTITRGIPRDLADALEARRMAPERRVWPWLDSHSYCSIFPAIVSICDLARVKPRGWHGIRKASGSYVAAAGGNAQEHLGHRSERTTRTHYLDRRITGEQDASSILPKLDAG